MADLLCVPDNKVNAFSPEYEQLLKQFKDVIESDLTLIQSMNEQKKVKSGSYFLLKVTC
jgi:hypothetical protein